MNTQLLCFEPCTTAAVIAKNLNLMLSPKPPKLGLYLSFVDNQLGLCSADEPKLKPIIVDFVGGAQGHRRKYGGGKGQKIAKAVGFKSKYPPKSILDLTAGLGRDSFVFAQLGAEITLYERHPWVYALL